MTEGKDGAPQAKRKSRANGRGRADLMPAPTSPMAVGRKLAAGYQSDDYQTLRTWRGEWMTWRGAHWAEIEKEQIKSWTYRQLEHARYKDTEGHEKGWSPTRGKILNVLDSLAAITHQSQETDPPTWTDGHPPWDRGTVVACANGLLHVGTRHRYPLNPRWFNLVSVPFDYDGEAPDPVHWLTFLKTVWPDDDQSIEALQEWFGYVVSGRTDLQKILLMIGPTRSGKGTIARVISALMGRGNVAGPTLSSLGASFGLQPLLGKPLAIVSDARLAPQDSRTVVERLLSISGEDMLSVPRKYKDDWTGKIPSRFMILSNELPTFGDASAAIAHRFVILQMAQSFLGREDRDLYGRLLPELPGILNWALAGLDRLDQRGMLTRPQSSEDAANVLQDLASPISAFIRERCILGAGLEISVDALFALWQSWCELNNHHASNSAAFGRNLRASAPSVRVTQPRTEDGRERRYAGIGRAV